MFPIIVVLLAFSMQVALDYYAKQVAIGAAQAGVNAVRYAQLGPNDENQAVSIAKAAAQDYLTKHGGGMLRNPGMPVKYPILTAPSLATPTGQVDVEITGTPIQLLPIPSDPVDQLAAAPLENFTWGLG
jgi:hypothetical protein